MPAGDLRRGMSAGRPGRAAGLLLVAAAVAVGFALSLGSDGLRPGALVHLWSGEAQGIHADIVRDLRAPRVAAAFACGGLLALAGALMQVLFRNPLADPYVLGLAGGAGAGALAAGAFAVGVVSMFAGAWIGALASIALLLALGASGFRGSAASPAGADMQRILLVGVALASGWGAIVVLVLALAPDASLRGLVFWMMGDFDGAEDWRLPAAVLAAGTALAWLFGRDLDVMCLGDDTALALGVPVRRVRLVAVLLASVCTAAAVATAGTIGFVGLIVPNAMRRLLGNDQRVLLPACAVGGGILLVLADAVARAAVAPMQLPVGAVVALIGVPVFVLLVVRARAAP